MTMIKEQTAILTEAELDNEYLDFLEHYGELEVVSDNYYLTESASEMVGVYPSIRPQPALPFVADDTVESIEECADILSDAVNNLRNRHQVQFEAVFHEDDGEPAEVIHSTFKAIAKLGTYAIHALRAKFPVGLRVRQMPVFSSVDFTTYKTVETQSRTIAAVERLDLLIETVSALIPEITFDAQQANNDGRMKALFVCDQSIRAASYIVRQLEDAYAKIHKFVRRRDT